jgi:hypothetical protein
MLEKMFCSQNTHKHGALKCSSKREAWPKSKFYLIFDWAGVTAKSPLLYTGGRDNSTYVEQSGTHCSYSMKVTASFPLESLGKLNMGVTLILRSLILGKS